MHNARKKGTHVRHAKAKVHKAWWRVMLKRRETLVASNLVLLEEEKFGTANPRFRILIYFFRRFQYCDIWGSHITDVSDDVFRNGITLLWLKILIAAVIFNVFNIMFWNQAIFLNIFVSLIVDNVRLLWTSCVINHLLLIV